jgi:hypothetical protein
VGFFECHLTVFELFKYLPPIYKSKNSDLCKKNCFLCDKIKMSNPRGESKEPAPVKKQNHSQKSSLSCAFSEAYAAMRAYLFSGRRVFFILSLQNVWR